MSGHVEVTRSGSRIEIVLDRPEKKNALTGAMYLAMAEAFAEAEHDGGVLSVLIAARGSTFCAGNDLIDFKMNPPTGPESPVARFLTAISSSSRVVLAAVQGTAVGVGATMLLHCDHVVAAADASLQYAFVKMALVPEAASSLLLPRVVGPLKAAELMFTGDRLPVEEALSLGLVSRIVPTGEELECARAFAGRLDGVPPGALRATKLLLRSEVQGVAGRMTAEGEVFRRQLASVEFAEAVRAFLERRTPVYTG